MEKIRAVIVDDEESARDVLENLLLLFCNNVEIVAKCTNVMDAVTAISQLKPDVVFLDIEMPKYAGYEIVNFIDEIDFEIIFVTAYDQYAIRAFEVAALDYLLKPVNIERLQSSLQRVRMRITSLNHQKEQLQHLKNSIESKEVKSLLIFDKSEQQVLPFETIIALEAQESYTIIHTIDQTYVVSKNLRHFENTLEGIGRFFRAHRSWIVNKEHITSFSKTDLTICLTGQLTTKLSKYRKAEFEEFLIS